jgi:hypothetical protein
LERLDYKEIKQEKGVIMSPQIIDTTENTKDKIVFKKIVKILDRYCNTPWEVLNTIFPIAEAALATHLERKPSDASEAKYIAQFWATDFLLKMNKLCEVAERYQGDREKIRKELDIYWEKVRPAWGKWIEDTNNQNYLGR